MGRGPRRLTPAGWIEFLNNKTDKQLYWFLRHMGYTRDYIKFALNDYEIPIDTLNHLSFLKLIQTHKCDIIDIVVAEMENNQ